MAFFESRASRVLLSSMGLFVLAAVGAWVALYLTFLRDLPDLRSVEDYRPPIASRVLDREGAVVGSFFEE